MFAYREGFLIDYNLYSGKMKKKWEGQIFSKKKTKDTIRSSF